MKRLLFCIALLAILPCCDPVDVKESVSFDGVKETVEVDVLPMATNPIEMPKVHDSTPVAM